MWGQSGVIERWLEFLGVFSCLDNKAFEEGCKDVILFSNSKMLIRLRIKVSKYSRTRAGGFVCL